MLEIQRELQLLDESLDFALEFSGACAQLEEVANSKRETNVLDTLKEKPFAQLTHEERELLRNLTLKR